MKAFKMFGKVDTSNIKKFDTNFKPTTHIKCHIWKETEGNWGHVSLEIPDKRTYLSFWPADGASMTSKEGKVSPGVGGLSNFEIDKLSEAVSFDEKNRPIPKDPDETISIPVDAAILEEVYKKAIEFIELANGNKVSYIGANIYEQENAFNCITAVNQAFQNTPFQAQTRYLTHPSHYADALNEIIKKSMPEEELQQKNRQEGGSPTLTG